MSDIDAAPAPARAAPLKLARKERKRVSTAITADFDAQMRTLLSDVLRAADVKNDDAVSMLYAAAVVSLETGNIAEETYRAHVATMIETLIAGMGALQ